MLQSVSNTGTEANLVARSAKTDGIIAVSAVATVTGLGFAAGALAGSPGYGAAIGALGGTFAAMATAPAALPLVR